MLSKDIDKIPITGEVPKADVWIRADYRDIVHRLGEVHLIRACEHQHDDDFVPMYDFQVVEEYQVKTENMRLQKERAWNKVDEIARDRDNALKDLEFQTEARVKDAKDFREKLSALRPYRVLRAAVDAMMAQLGYHGTICARDDRVQAVMDALAQIDNEDRGVDTSNGGFECDECHAKKGTVCSDADCPGSRAQAD